MKPTILSIHPAKTTTKQRIPLFTTKVAAGFPSPADDFIERKLDLNKHLIKHPSSTFFVRVSGDSMIGASIHDGDILIVDRSRAPTNKKIIIAVINGELTVKRIRKVGRTLYLVPENDQYAPIQITEAMEFQVWGVVTTVIHQV